MQSVRFRQGASILHILNIHYHHIHEVALLRILKQHKGKQVIVLKRDNVQMVRSPCARENTVADETIIINSYGLK